MVSSSSTLRNVRLSIVVTSAAVISLLFLPLTVFAQLEEEGGGVAVEAEENATATTTTSEAATNETAAAAAAASPEAAAASPARNNMTEGVKFLAIQTAQSGTLSQINATAYTLELRNISDKTILFSDRPDRIVTSQSTSDFVGNWTMGEDSFAADPPNAVLVLDDEEERQEIAVIELFNPEYDSEANTLRYDITAENATTTTTSSSIDLPSEFGQSTLVIDDDGGGRGGDDDGGGFTSDGQPVVGGGGGLFTPFD
jgi:hypothetical protein